MKTLSRNYPDDPSVTSSAVASMADEDVELEYCAKLLEDFRFFCAAEYQVKNNNPNHATAELEQWVPFVWNSQQEKLASMITRDWAEGKPMQYIILKARQWGCTTLICAFNIWVMLCKDGANIQVLAQDEDATQTIYEMYEDCYDDLFERNNDWMPERPFSNRKRGFRLSNKSRLRIQTAGTEATAKKVGRSKTNTILHLSEEAFWTAARKTLTAILQTVTLGKKKGVFRESTPNGASGSFYHAYQKAKQGLSDYKAIFVAWHHIEWYEMPCDADQLAAWRLWRETGKEKFRVAGGFEEDEDNRITDYNLTPQKWLWWGWALHNKCDSDPDTMRQEFPDDDISCFLESGSPVFRPKDVSRCADVQPPQRYELWLDKGQIGYRPDRRGAFRIWELPETTGDYLLSADICGGFSSRDRSIAVVWKRTPTGLVQAATYCGRPEPDEFAGHIFMLHVMYNRALCAPEANTYGKSVIDYLKKMGATRFYRRKAYDQVTRQYTALELGWYTSSTSKPTLIAAAKKYLREGLVTIKDAECIAEIRTYIKDTKTGKEQAASGSMDDYNDAMMIACRVDEDTKIRAHPNKSAMVIDAPEKSMEKMFLQELLRPQQVARKMGIAHQLASMGFYPERDSE